MKTSLFMATFLAIALVISFGIWKTAGAVTDSNKGQYLTIPQSIILNVPMSQLFSGVQTSEITTVRVATESIINVPKGSIVAHVDTGKNIIDVQRFIDTTTGIACYYSENAGAVVAVNCVQVK